MIVESFHATAAELHALVAPTDDERRLWHLVPRRPAVILGSTQPLSDVDVDAAAANGVEVTNRRSGGGAVWVDQTGPLWLDIWIPRGDPLWTDDVQRAFVPIGEAWSVALGNLGVVDLSVHQGSMLCFTGSRQVCFAGVGPGEVLHDPSTDSPSVAAKLVGISQRRTRHGARFQCALYWTWDPGPLHQLLREPPPLHVLRDRAVGLADIGAGEIRAADVISEVAEVLGATRPS